MSKTRKPCPGCGRIVTREADSVCTECRFKLDGLTALLAAIEADDSCEIVIGPERNYAVDGFYEEGPLPIALHDRLKASLHQIFKVSSILSPRHQTRYWEFLIPGMAAGDPKRPMMPMHDDWKAPAVVPTGFQAAMVELDLAIAEAFVSVYNAGLARGSNLLVSLADGEITLDEFNAGRQATRHLSEARQKRAEQAKESA